MDIDEKGAALNALATLRDPKSSQDGIQDFRNAFLAASRPSFSSPGPLAMHATMPCWRSKSSCRLGRHLTKSRSRRLLLPWCRGSMPCGLINDHCCVLWRAIEIIRNTYVYETVWVYIRCKGALATWAVPMKQLAEYLQHAIEFQALAAREANPTLQARYQEQADTYRALAEKRAADLGINVPTLVDSS
jgi:hypothetical protein